jgi:hypothetical protein
MEGALGIQVREELIRHHRARQRCPSPQISSKLVDVQADKNLANLGVAQPHMHWRPSQGV